MRPEQIPVVAIDGPASSGKGTISMRIAARLGYHLLDSGALYRLVGLVARRARADMRDAELLARLARRLDVRFVPGGGETRRILLQGEEVTALLRGEQASLDASLVAAVPAVRAALLERQRSHRAPPGLVADGRDMGTRVFPDAGVKIFLTASPEARAARRYAQLKDGASGVSLALTLQSIQERDRQDLERTASPLRPAEDAVVLDTTDMNIEEVSAFVWREIHACGLAPPLS